MRASVIPDARFDSHLVVVSGCMTVRVVAVRRVTMRVVVVRRVPVRIMAVWVVTVWGVTVTGVCVAVPALRQVWTGGSAVGRIASDRT